MEQQELQALIDLINKAQLVMLITNEHKVGLGRDMQDKIIEGLNGLKH